MPCYSQRTISVNLEAADEQVLRRALTATLEPGTVTGTLVTGFAGRTLNGQSCRVVNGKVIVTGSYVTQREVEATAAAITLAYAKEAAQLAASRNGWAFSTNKQTGQVTLTRKAW